MRVLAVALSFALAACGSSHTAGDSGVDPGECEGPAPTGCTTPGAGNCCLPTPARCGSSGEWICNPAGFMCEGTCGTDTCSGDPPTCFQDLGGDCCGAEVAAICTTPLWSCVGGSLREADCEGFAPACGMAGGCEGNSEADCIGRAECVPLYDDDCCPMCRSGGGCSDCARPQMYACVRLDEACLPEPPCGLSTPWTCRPAALDCTTSNPASGGRCDVPGCIQAQPAACSGDCDPECIPVTRELCHATCEILPPACPDGFVAEADGVCFTGRCIAASACVPP